MAQPTIVCTLLESGATFLSRSLCIEPELEEAKNMFRNFTYLHRLLLAFSKRSMERASEVLRMEACKVFVDHEGLLGISKNDLNLRLVHCPVIVR
jgi:hypothetical protein